MNKHVDTSATIDLCEKIIARCEARRRFEQLIEESRRAAEREVTYRRAGYALAMFGGV